RDLVLPPVLHPVPGFRDLVTAGLVMLVRHRQIIVPGAGGRSIILHQRPTHAARCRFVHQRVQRGEASTSPEPLLAKASGRLDIRSFYHHRNMEEVAMPEDPADEIARYADMLSALGAEPRLRIVRLLLAAHPEGLVVGEIGAELGIPPSTLSHHLDKLKNEDLVSVRRESTFLRYTANTKTLEEIVGFL